MENLDIWVKTPASAHASWRASLTLATRAAPEGAPYAQQSQRLYISLFSVFCRWLCAESVNVLTLAHEDLMRFQGTLKGRDDFPASDRTLRTYIAEIDRVMTYLVGMGARKDNPATTLLSQLKLEKPLRPRSICFPPPGRAEAYVDWLGQQEPSSMHPEDIQSAAMNLLMLENGLTLKEIQKMVLAQLDGLQEGRVRAPGHRSVQQRTLPLTSHAQSWITAWLAARNRLKLVSKEQRAAWALPSPERAVLAKPAKTNKLFVAFPARAEGITSLNVQGIVVDRVPEYTIYLNAQQVVFGAEQLSKNERQAQKNKGPQTLRSLCCARLLQQGLPSVEVASYMGLTRTDQVWAMSRAIKGMAIGAQVRA